MNDNALIYITCASCHAKNKIPAEKTDTKAKCGKCGAPLDFKNTDAGESAPLVLRCSACGGKNRVPAEKLDGNPKCGKCHEPIQTKDVMTGRTLSVTDSDFDEKVLKSPLPVLLDGWSPWCGVCKMSIPIIDKLAAEWKGRVRVCRLDVSTNPLVANRFQIMSTPTALIFDGGRLLDTIVGAVPKTQLIQKMAPFLK
jgi:thioredoxin 2